jgi:NAD(P)-dependent dehydrogenase (short-subunit alcohol dehydrogenase family)
MRTVVIIGGSRGIGNAVLTNLIDNNRVINLSRTEPDITHPNLTHFKRNIISDELPYFEKIDALVYCPGSINLKPIKLLTNKDFREDFEINVIGAVTAIKTYLSSLEKSNNPSIVLFSSVATSLGMPYHSSIAASKSGLEGLVKSLGAELASKIRINAIAPTVTDTDLSSKLMRNTKMKELLAERHPLKKYLTPQEVAEMATYLISEKSSPITGQIFKLDCGIVSFKV